MAGPIVRFYDPTGRRYGIPTYPWRLAPEGLATRDQLVAEDLRPRGKPVAQVMWRSRRGTRVAYLYRRADAEPPKPRSPRQVAQLEEARRKRRICPECTAEKPYTISTKYRACADCITSLGLAA